MLLVSLNLLGALLWLTPGRIRQYQMHPIPKKRDERRTRHASPPAKCHTHPGHPRNLSGSPTYPDSGRSSRFNDIFYIES